MRNIILCLLFFLISFQKSLAQTANEYIYVHFDKAIYIAGEHLWYKVYLLNNDTHKTEHSILHIELLEPNGKTLVRQQLKIKDNNAFGDFTIPSNSLEGFYTFRTYIQTASEQEPYYIFQQEIPIYNLQKKEIKTIQKALIFPQKISVDSILSSQHIESGTLKIKANTDQSIYKKRSTLLLNIDTFNEAAERVASNLSISIIDLNHLPLLTPQNIANFQATNRNKQKTISSPAKELKKYFEFYKEQQKVNPDEVFLFLKEQQKATKGVKERKGFHWSFEEYYGTYNGQFFIYLNNQLDHDIIAKEAITKDNTIVVQPTLLPYTPDIEKYLLLKQKEILIQNVFQYPSSIIPMEQNTFPNQNGVPRKIYQTKKYSNLKNVGEFLDEVVANFSLHQKEGQLLPYIKNMDTKTTFSNPVYFLINKTFSQNFEQILDIPINQIEAINFYDDIASLKPFGLTYLAKTGIIELVWKANKKQSLNDIPIYEIEGFAIPHSIKHTVKPTNNPDFRTLIHWEPNLQISNKAASIIEVSLPDNRGTFLVQIEGISEKGENGVLYFTIKVD